MTTKNFHIALDTSGSMTKRLSGDTQELADYCLLDLAKILLLSFIKGIENGSTISVLGFSCNVSQIVPSTKVDSKSREVMEAQIRNSGIRPAGTTAMLEVLQSAVNEIQASFVDDKDNSEHIIILLTDGLPSKVPRLGLTGSLQEYVIQTNPALEFSLHTFGIGNGVDSALLDKLSETFGGSNVFVSDQGMAGATFTHRLANILVRKCKMPSSQLTEFSACFVTYLNDIISSLVDRGLEEAQQHVENLKIDLTKQVGGGSVTNKYTEQISIAVSKSSFAYSWGIHFLRSLLQAHKRFECHTFIDESVQPYISLYPDLWTVERDRFDDIFLNIDTPPPCISRPSTTAPIPLRGLQQAVANSVCLHEDSLVSMANGTEVMCKDLKPGDKILTDGSSSDTIECIVKGRCNTFTEMLKLPQGPRVTSWHPVLWEGTYQFPTNIKGVTRCESGMYKYSFLLENRSSTMIFDGIQAATLAHGLADDIVGHAFWGSEQVTASLRRISKSQFQSGIMVLENPKSVLNEDGTVIGLIDHWVTG